MTLALNSPIHLNATWWTLFVVLATALAFVHAFRKLSPYFAAAWFGSGLVFGWFWTTNRTSPEALLLPVLVTYLAAALTKGVVEQGRFAGNHLVHVLCAGIFAGFVALPLEAAAATMHWTVPHAAPALNLHLIDGPWFGGANPAVIVQWSLLGTLFYGTYKLLDHIGVGAVLQTVGLFAVMPFLPRFAEFLLKLA
jgi:hypothetical protein